MRLYLDDIDDIALINRPLLQVPRTQTAYGGRAFSSAVPYQLSGTIFQPQSLNQSACFPSPTQDISVHCCF